MSRIPKKAQRAIDAANQARAQQPAGQPAAKPTMPTRLNILKMPGQYCRLYDVYFNGQKQTLCQIADTEAGYIVRYTEGRYDPVAKAYAPLPPYTTEQLHGDVVIRLKGKAAEQDLVKKTGKPWEDI